MSGVGGGSSTNLAAINLEQHLDSMEKLPAELQKNYVLMRNLDNKAKKMSQRIDHDSDVCLALIRSGGLSQKKHKEEVAKIEKLYAKLWASLDEKVAIAVQTYELVDKHIRYLDADLSRFEAECRESEKTSSAQVASSVQRPSSNSGSAALKKAVSFGPRKQGSSAAAAKGRKKSRLSSDVSLEAETTEESSKVVRKIPAAVAAAAALALPSAPHLTAEADADGSLLTFPAETPAEVFDMPVDPNEPTYCLCQQVSFGEMVGCDNADCSIEWFHFPCVGLTVKPKGKWYCPRCSEERKRKK